MFGNTILPQILIAIFVSFWVLGYHVLNMIYLCIYQYVIIKLLTFLIKIASRDAIIMYYQIYIITQLRSNLNVILSFLFHQFVFVVP
jgi:hypothetical protein